MDSKESFNNFSLLIANKYIDKGWKYSKSKHWMTKKDKNFTYKVCFYSSVRNISNIDVDFYAGSYIISNRNKEIVYYDSSQNTPNKSGKLSWNIANEEIFGANLSLIMFIIPKPNIIAAPTKITKPICCVIPTFLSPTQILNIVSDANTAVAIAEPE